MRPQFVVVSVVVLLVVAGLWLWSRPDRHATPSGTEKVTETKPRTSRSIRRASAAPRPPDGEGSADIPPKDLADFDIFPPAHQPDAINAALDDMPEWLGASYSDARPELLGIDCEFPPCLIGLRYEDDGISDPDRLLQFSNVYRAEVERRLGYPMTATEMLEDKNGKQVVWMYAVPADLSSEDGGIVDDLREDAGARTLRHVQAGLPDIEPAVQQSGEAPAG